MAGCEVCLYGSYSCPCCETGTYAPSFCNVCDEREEDCVCECEECAEVNDSCVCNEDWFSLHYDFVTDGKVSARDVRVMKRLSYTIEKEIANVKEKYPKSKSVCVIFSEGVHFGELESEKFFEPTSVWISNELDGSASWSIARDLKTANVKIHFTIEDAETAYKFISQIVNYLENRYLP